MEWNMKGLRCPQMYSVGLWGRLAD